MIVRSNNVYILELEYLIQEIALLIEGMRSHLHKQPCYPVDAMAASVNSKGLEIVKLILGCFYCIVPYTVDSNKTVMQ